MTELKRSMRPPVAERGSKKENRLTGAILKRIQGILDTSDIPPNPIADVRDQAMLDKLSPSQRADMLYDKMVAYTEDNSPKSESKDTDTAEDGSTSEPKDANARFKSSLLRRIRLLYNDEATRDLFARTYAEARIDDKTYKTSELGKQWKDAKEKLRVTEEAFNALATDIVTGKISNKTELTEARTELALLAEEMFEYRDTQEMLIMLRDESGDRKIDLTKENTDISARNQFERLKEYRDQLDAGFVWTKSRKDIDTETVSALGNGRWPVLMGEAGTGKTWQGKHAMRLFTGKDPISVACGEKTSTEELLGEIALDASGASYVKYGKLVRAATGLIDSRGLSESRESTTGRGVLFDEFNRLGEQVYAVIKDARTQAKAGGQFDGQSVLHGFVGIGTANPPGPRYPGRHKLDVALAREFQSINVPYLEQTPQNPECFEVIVPALMDKKYHIEGVALSEVMPAYEKKVFKDEEKIALRDGSTAIAQDELIADETDMRHGIVYRLANAVHALQLAFEYHNQPAGSQPNDALRFNTVGDKVEVGTSGALLTLNASVITPGELTSWMTGFIERHQSREKKLHVPTLTEWIQLKLNTYIDQVDALDREKVRALFEYYHLLDTPAPDLRKAKPLTPKQIGYLSPRVPRPYYVEKPAVVEIEELKLDDESKPETIIYTNEEVGLEDGSAVNIMKGPAEFVSVLNEEGSKEEKFTINPRMRFMVNGNRYRFAGAVSQDGHDKNGNPVGERAEEDKVHEIFTPEEVEKGTIDCSFIEIEELVGTVCPVNK